MSKAKWIINYDVRPTDEQIAEWPLERIEREWKMPKWVVDVINEGDRYCKRCCKKSKK